MKASSPERLLPFNLDLLFRQRWGQLLLVSMAALAIVPVLLLGFASYRIAADGLLREAGQRVRMAAEWDHGQLAALLDGRLSGGAIPDQRPGPPPDFDAIDQMFAARDPGEDQYRRYLVDADLILRAGSTGGGHAAGEPIAETEPIRRWRRQLTTGSSTATPVKPSVYEGPAGTSVVGTLVPLDVGQHPCALCVEVDVTVVLGALRVLRAIFAGATILIAAGVLVAAAMLAQRIINPIRGLSHKVGMAVGSHAEPAVAVSGGNAIEVLEGLIERLLDELQTIAAQHDAHKRFMSNLNRLHQLISGEQKLGDLSLNTLDFLCNALDLQRADFFIVTESHELERIGRLPRHRTPEADRILVETDARVARAATERTSAWYGSDASGGSPQPVSAGEHAHLITTPLMIQHKVNGVLELEKKSAFSRSDARFLEAAVELITIALNAAMLRRQEKALLDRSQQQADALQSREAALQVKTRELQGQTRALQASEETLQLKQLELQAANAQMSKNAADLEAHMAILEQQKKDIQKQNRKLEAAHRDLAQKARQLELSSQYKTEFMANMSHELRTPLNSILLLSRLLTENKEKNLTAKQSEFARTIQSAGEDLLHLINEILDLAKVESGKMEVEYAPVNIHAVTQAMLVSFTPLAEQSGITFTIHVDPDVPDELITDRKRLEQIIKNFLSNAFKFTVTGSVRLEIERHPKTGRTNSDTSPAVTVSVVDTGIGIPAAKQEMVFEAFQQVDGSIRRKYGGTGLGLSISRELARMLGGEITLKSKDGRGSRFTLQLPLRPLPENQPALIRSKTPERKQVLSAAAHPGDRSAGGSIATGYVPDDRNRLMPGDTCILIIDTNVDTIDAIQARAREAGFKVLVADQFPTGLHFADYHRPTAIFLNAALKDGNGWEMVAGIKDNPGSRHIPVFVISSAGSTFTAACHRAAGHIDEPVDTDRLDASFQTLIELQALTHRSILVAAPDRTQAVQTAATFEGPGIQAVVATTSQHATAILASSAVHAVVVHPAMIATDEHHFISDLEDVPLPILYYAGGDQSTDLHALARTDVERLNVHAVGTPEQLLATIVTCLHLAPEGLKKEQVDRLRSMDERCSGLKGRRVLLADDDMRTVFAVSNILEDQGVEVITGKTGKESLDKLHGFPDIDLVLMDVMISGLDGYQAIREIRAQQRYGDLPIIALTAKAMRGDRSKCIQAGADDYLAKPVNLDKLTSMLNIWFRLKGIAS